MLTRVLRFAVSKYIRALEDAGKCFKERSLTD